MTIEDQRRAARDAAFRRKQIAEIVAHNRYLERRAKDDEMRRVYGSDTIGELWRRALDEEVAQERAENAVREAGRRQRIDDRRQAGARDHEARVAALTARAQRTSEHDARIAVLTARRNGGAPAPVSPSIATRPTSLPAVPKLTRDGVDRVLHRSGISDDTIRSRGVGEIMRARPGAVVAIGSHEVRVSDGGELAVHRRGHGPLEVQATRLSSTNKRAET